MVRVVGGLQMTWLQKFHLDVRVPHLYSEVVVLTQIWSPPLLVQFPHCPRLVSQFSCRSQEYSLLKFQAV